MHIILILPLGETPEGPHGPHHCSAKGCNDKDSNLNKYDLKFKLFARKRQASAEMTVDMTMVRIKY